MPNEQLPVDYGFDPSTGQPLSLPVDREPNPIAAKPYVMASDLVGTQLQEQSLPVGYALNDAGIPFNIKTGKEDLPIIRRPSVLPIAKTPDGYTVAMPKALDALGSVMGPLAAGKVPLAAGEALLGSGAIRTSAEAPWVVKGFEDANWFHGTTHEFDKFKLAKGNPENHLGQYPHFTSSPEDAAANYAGHGPDLTQRIEILAEQKYLPDEMPAYGTEEYKKVYAEAKAKATKELAGPHEGAIIPAKMKLENPASLIDSKPTWLDFNAKVDKDGEWVKDSPLMTKLQKSFIKQGKKYNFDGQKAFDEVAEKANLYEGDVKASELNKAMRETESLMYADNEHGALIGSHVISNVFKDLGFDGIVMNAKEAFPNMKNIPEGTLHAVPLKQNTVKGKYNDATLFSDTRPQVASALARSLDKQNNAPAFYSGLEKAVETAKPTIATADQWLGYLKNQPGVKSEELATVLKELPSGPITKEALNDIVKANKVELGEVVKGHDNVKELAIKLAEDENGKGSWDRIGGGGQEHYWRDAEKELKQKRSEPKFSQYQLPGGENYKEMLLTLPENKNFGVKAAEGKYRLFDYKTNDYVRTPDGKVRTGYDTETAANEAAVGLNKTSGSNPMQNFKSSHWDEPNVLAHIRMNDRQLPKEFTPAEQEALKLHEEAQPKLAANREAQGNVGKEISAASKPLEAKRRAAILAENKAGKISNAEAQRQIEDYIVPKELKPLQDKLEALRKEETDLRKSLPQKPEQQTSKTLHLEEIQSDWHQKGRKEGYKLDPKEKARLDTNAETVDNKLTAANAEDIMGNPDLDAGLKQAVERKILSQKEADDYKYLVKNENGTVPDAPFKKNWDELALKKMIHKAASEGYEGISWTPGEAQAARYDLSKQIEKIHYNKKTNMLAAYDKNGSTAINKKVTPEELPDVIGKETSEKLLTKGNKLTEDSVELQNADLKIGGEGMKSFYDKMLVDKANALAKKYGSKVEQKEVGKPLTKDERQERHDIYSLPEKVRTPTQQKRMEELDSRDAFAKESAEFIHYLPLTPELKKKALQEGFPLFSSSPIITPVDHDPWERKYDHKAHSKWRDS